jgi:hypothetical protein
VTRLSTAFLISLLLFNSLVIAPPALNAQAPAATTQPPAAAARAPAQTAQAAASKIHVDILEGDGQIVNIKARINLAPVVQVVDDKNQPLPGALVVFFLPTQGPGGTFPDGSRNLTVSTDRNGHAAAAGIVPNDQTGQFSIRASASYQGQTASADITQVNVSGVSASGTGGGGLSAKAWILIGVVAGAAVGGVLAARSGGSNSSTSGNTGIVITAGTPTVGARP